jgi:hypothetical protein
VGVGEPRKKAIPASEAILQKNGSLGAVLENIPAAAKDSLILRSHRGFWSNPSPHTRPCDALLLGNVNERLEICEVLSHLCIGRVISHPFRPGVCNGYLLRSSTCLGIIVSFVNRMLKGANQNRWSTADSLQEGPK